MFLSFHLSRFNGREYNIAHSLELLSQVFKFSMNYSFFLNNNEGCSNVNGFKFIENVSKIMKTRFYNYYK